MRLKVFLCLIMYLLITQSTIARICQFPSSWTALCPILNNRVAQVSPKMKLTESEALNLEEFLVTTKDKFPNLLTLQKIVPKTTLELLMAIHARGVPSNEAEKIAAYLIEMTTQFKFKNIPAFDTNTSHIIGRDWHQIDYTGEGMTWQGQKAAYAVHGIKNFKTAENIKAFFKIESKLRYFKKVYFN